MTKDASDMVISTAGKVVFDSKFGGPHQPHTGTPKAGVVNAGGDAMVQPGGTPSAERMVPPVGIPSGAGMMPSEGGGKASHHCGIARGFG